jgi:hypothetical protein
MIFFVPFLSTRHQYAIGPSSLECYMTLGLSLQFGLQKCNRNSRCKLILVIFILVLLEPVVIKVICEVMFSLNLTLILSIPLILLFCPYP